MDLPKEEKSLESKSNKSNKPPEENNNFDDSLSSHESIFDEDLSNLSNKNEEEKVEEEKNNNNNNSLINNSNILNMLLNKKKKRELTEEEKAERIKKNIERYCKRNDRMLELLEKINQNEITRKNVDEMMRLLAIDLSDTKKLANKKGLISEKKKDLFNKLFELTFKEYQLFWHKLTNGQYKKGNAQLINSGNIGTAKMIYDKIIEERKNNMNNKEEKEKEKTVREIINIKNNMEIEDEKFDEVFLKYDPDISSDEDSLDSSVHDSLSDASDNITFGSVITVNSVNNDVPVSFSARVYACSDITSSSKDYVIAIPDEDVEAEKINDSNTSAKYEYFKTDDVLCIDAQYVLADEKGNTYVLLKVDDNDSLVKRNVTVVKKNSEIAWIASGLNEGDVCFALDK